MAYEIPLFTLGSLVAAADLTTRQYQLGVIDTAGKVALSGLGAAAVGVIQNKPNTGEAVQLGILGVQMVKTGAAVNRGDRLKSDANGKAIAAAAATVNTSDAGITSDPVVGSHVFGIALEAATAADQIISVLMVHMGAVPTTAA